MKSNRFSSCPDQLEILSERALTTNIRGGFNVKLNKKIIVGNNLTSLILAIELAEKGYDIKLVETGSLGGHFKGINFNNYNFDLGMILFEFSSFNKESRANLLTYNPAIKNDVGRFVTVVEEYLSKLISFREIETPKLFFQGEYYEDYLIANSLETINQILSDEQYKTIKYELNLITNKKEKEIFHASNKSTPLFKKLNFKNISIENHGATFHKIFIDPFISKVLNIPSEKIPATYHRNAWAPLFYPETLLQQLDNGNNNLQETVFHYPISLNTSDLISNLLEKINKNKNIQIINNRITDLNISENQVIINFNEGGTLKSDHLIWTSEGKSLINLLEMKDNYSDFERTDIIFSFLVIKKSMLKKVFNILNVLDKEYCIYRITNYTYLANSKEDIVRLCIEINLSYLLEIKKDLEYKQIIEDELISMGIVRDSTDILFHEYFIKRNALILPTFRNMQLFDEIKKEIANLPKQIEVLGSANNFLVNSMNDQVVEALKYLEQLNKERN